MKNKTVFDMRKIRWPSCDWLNWIIKHELLASKSANISSNEISIDEIKMIISIRRIFRPIAKLLQNPYSLLCLHVSLLIFDIFRYVSLLWYFYLSKITHIINLANFLFISNKFCIIVKKKQSAYILFGIFIMF